MRKVVMWGNQTSWFHGVRFYDENNTEILEAGCCSSSASKTFTLEKNERLVGIKAK